jgi:ADP-ribose pyrophosphatase YjhB (NUDIX family)
MEYWKFIRSKVGKSKVIIPGADGAIIQDGKILLVENKDLREYFLPGGLMELNESIEETVLREVKEELGIMARVKELISVFSHPKWIKEYKNGDILQTMSFLFLLEANFNNFEINKDEIINYGWFEQNNIPKNINNYSKLMCEDVFRFKGHVFLH